MIIFDQAISRQLRAEAQSPARAGLEPDPQPEGQHASEPALPGPSLRCRRHDQRHRQLHRVQLVPEALNGTKSTDIGLGCVFEIFAEINCIIFERS